MKQEPLHREIAAMRRVDIIRIAMGAREFEIDRDALLRIEAREGDRLHVRSGDVWVTQHGDSRDYVLRTGDSMILSGKGATLAVAYQPSVLALYRDDRRA